MDRNREGRRAASSMVTTSNGGGTLSRRRHRSGTSLRDSTDEDGGVELQESIRLRDRVKKERDLRERDRERERERERERASRTSCKRRPDRPLINNNNNINNRSEDLGLVDDSSEESVNDDEDEEYEDNHHNLHHSNSGFGGGGGGGVRLLPPAGGISNHYNNNNNQPIQHRKTFPPSGNNNGNSNKTNRVAPVWKSGHEMIGVSVPRKARSAATKRSHDWMPSNSGGEQPIQQPILTSPARHSVVTAAPSSAPVAPPMSPSSSNASVRKKLKLSNGSKSRPSKGSSVAKSTSSNPEEIEIEIAEVLFGLMTQTQGPSSSKKDNSSNDSKEENNRSNNDSKSRVSSPISASNIGPPLSVLPKNSTSSATPFTAVEPKRKRPRQVPNNLASSSARCSPISSTKVEMDQTVKMEVSTSNSSPSLTPGSAAVSYDLGSLPNSQQQPEPMKTDIEKMPLEDEFVDKKEKEEVGCSMKKDSPVVRQDERICDDASASSSAVAGVGTDTLVGSVNKGSSNMVEVERYREDKFQIDLMAPPPQSRMSLEEKEEEVDLPIDDKKPNLLNVAVTNTVATTDKESEKMEKGGNVNVGGESKKATFDTEHVELKRKVESKNHNIDLRLDLEMSGETVTKLQQQETVAKSTTKEEPHDEKPGLSSSSSIPMSVPSWPGGLSPMGYMAPLQGAVSMDGGGVPPAPIQMPMFSQPRQKRCATHCYIARNIHYMQQFMKMNPFWSAAAAAAASSASLFGSKVGNVTALPSEDARGVSHSQDNKGQVGHGGKEKGSQHLNSSNSVQRNPQIMVQQTMPPVAPNNILGPAFIFPLNQQQAAMAAAVRPGSANSPAITLGAPSSNAANSSAVSSSMSYNYPNMPGNETQYLAILQNNAYPFPIPTVGANPNYRGPHPQPFPLFNGFSYSSQMIHPSQIQQQPVPPTSQTQQVQQSHRSALLSSSSSSTHKNLPSQQQTSQGNGNLQQVAAKSRASQQSSTNQHPQVPRFRQLDNQMGSGDAPTTMNMYGQNFAMPMHIPNFALIPPPATSASSNPADKKHHQSQQPGIKTGIESLPPQTFAMSFGPINGATNPGFDLSMAQNHAIFQNFSDASRHNFQMMAAATAGQNAHHKKDARASEDDKSGGGGDHSDCADDERKGSSSKVSTTAGQSIAFSISELPDRSHVFESSSRSLNPASASVRASGVQNAQLQVQLQHQQQHLMQLHKQHQQQLTARGKSPATSNGSVYPNALSFPQNVVQNNNSNCPSQSPQWKNHPRTTSSQNPPSFPSSSSGSLKNIPQQPARSLQNLTQISFGSNQKTAAASHRQQPPGSNQASSPPVIVGSPTTSSVSKGASGSPRITTTSSTSNKIGPATQQRKGSPSGPNQKSSPSTGSGRNVPSILGNPQSAAPSTSGIKSQMQQHAHQQQQMAKNLQQALFFSNPYMQNQSLQATSTNAPSISGNTGYYLQRRRPDQQQNSPQQPPGSSTGMLSLTGGSTMDPAKAIVAATAAAASNIKGGGLPSHSILNASQFSDQPSGNHHNLVSGGFSYGHSVPAAVQMKAAEEKKPTGNDGSHEAWQAEKK